MNLSVLATSPRQNSNTLIYESHETPINLNANAESFGNEIYEKSVQAFVDYTLVIAER